MNKRVVRLRAWRIHHVFTERRFHRGSERSFEEAQHRASIPRLSIGTPFSSNRRDKSSPWDGWIARKSSSWLAFEKPFFSIIERVSSTISPTWLESVAAIEIYRGGRARNAFDALDCIKVAANPVRARLMGYELWRFAPLLSLSLSLVRATYRCFRRNYSVPSAFFWREEEVCFSVGWRDTGLLPAVKSDA